MIDLKNLSAGKYKVTLDPSAELDPSREERLWYWRIPGPKRVAEFNFIGVHGPGELFVTSNKPRLHRPLMAIPGSRVRQPGAKEIAVVFAPEHLDLAAEIIHAQRRRHYNLSPEERERRVERMRSGWKAPSKTGPGAAPGDSDEVA
jgi:hypothetical protein